MQIRQHIGNVDININTKRIDKNVAEAQMLLNLQVKADCEPLVPFDQGGLRGSVTFPEGVHGGLIEYNASYAHAVYEGYVFTPNIPIKDREGNITGWFSPPGKKKQKTDRKMKFHTPGTTDHFFEGAKEQHKDDWIRLVRETVGKE